MVVFSGMMHVVLSEGLVPKEVVTTQVVAKFLKETEDVSNAIHCW